MCSERDEGLSASVVCAGLLKSASFFSVSYATCALTCLSARKNCLPELWLEVHKKAINCGRLPLCHAALQTKARLIQSRNVFFVHTEDYNEGNARVHDFTSITKASSLEHSGVVAYSSICFSSVSRNDDRGPASSQPPPPLGAPLQSQKMPL